ncbi:hypothetical protein J6590_028704 [Homalodisca vitripennis]|nr:hypothetical protein J6590_028704 [Homalodisca vitripennis]
MFQVNLNISELFPTLAWEGEELARRDDTDTLAAVTSDAESSEDNELNTKYNLETELRKWKNLRMEYRGGGSLLDRWARFESPPPEPPVKKPKPLTPEPTFNLDDFTGCSAFRTSNCWSESKLLRTLSDSSEVLPSGVSVEEPLEVANVITNEISNLPPTPPKETKTPPPPQTHRINNLSAQSNGPVSIEGKSENTKKRDSLHLCLSVDLNDTNKDKDPLSDVAELPNYLSEGVKISREPPDSDGSTEDLAKFLDEFLSDVPDLRDPDFLSEIIPYPKVFLKDILDSFN